jgi:hypothetical protein
MNTMEFAELEEKGENGPPIRAESRDNESRFSVFCNPMRAKSSDLAAAEDLAFCRKCDNEYSWKITVLRINIVT